MNCDYDFSYEYEEDYSENTYSGSYTTNEYSNDYLGNAYSDTCIDSANNEEQIRKQIYETEEEMQRWDMLSRTIKDMEREIINDNNRALERIDNMREISSNGDVVLSQLWEMKASILQNLNRNSYDFNEMFEEEDRSIRAEYETKVSGLYEELRGY